jgi:hypothetical protein
MALCCIVSALTLPSASVGLRAWRRSYTARSFNNNRRPGQRDYHGSMRSDYTCCIQMGLYHELLPTGSPDARQQTRQSAGVNCQVMRPAKQANITAQSSGSGEGILGCSRCSNVMRSPGSCAAALALSSPIVVADHSRP